MILNKNQVINKLIRKKINTAIIIIVSGICFIKKQFYGDKMIKRIILREKVVKIHMKTYICSLFF